VGFNSGETQKGDVVVNEWRNRQVSARRFAIVGSSLAVLLSGTIGLTSTTLASAAPKVPVAKVVAQAKVLSKLMNKGFVWSTTNNPTKPGQIVPYGTWRGPTSAPAPAKTGIVDVIVCTSGSVACVEAGQGVQAAAKALGWTVHVYDGGFNPAGYATAYASAMADKPNAIIGVAVPADQVQAQLVAANAAGIVTVGVGDIPPSTKGLIPYNAYVDFRMPLMESMLAYYEIARTNGKANTIVATDTSFGSLIQSQKEFGTVMAQCSTCKVKNISWSLTDAFSASTITADINGALASDPKAKAISLPYSIPESTVVAALAAAGKTGSVKLYAKDADAAGLNAVLQGQSAANAGASAIWAGWAGVDQVIRGMAHSKYLSIGQQGIGVAFFTKANTPKSGNIDDYPPVPNFPAFYKKAWGLA
jgi:hypothetical protein